MYVDDSEAPPCREEVERSVWMCVVNKKSSHKSVKCEVLSVLKCEEV